MKKRVVNFLGIISVVALCFLSSCYTYSVTVGKGPQGNSEQRKMNIYLIEGLAPVSVSDAKEMVGGASDYSVTITHTFVDGLLTAITGGIFSPTTTIVKK